MDLLEIMLLVVVAGICGAVAEFLVGFSPGSLFLVMLTGVVGAFIGNWLAVLASAAISGFPSILLVRVGTISFDIVWAIIGSIAVLELLALLRGGRRRGIFARDTQG